MDTTGLNGTVTIAADGQGVVYSVGNAFQSLRVGQSAAEQFSYTMQDGSGAISTATVTMIVLGTNDAPVANADTLTVSEDASNVTLTVLANDTDPNSLFTVTSIDGEGRYSAPRFGFFDGAVQFIGLTPGFPRLLGNATIAPDGRSIIYTPMQSLNAGETGVDTFDYTITSSSGETSTSVVTVNVTGGANDAPTAVNDSVTVEGGLVSIIIDVLANDTNPDTRIDPPRPEFPPSDFNFLRQDPTPADVPDSKTVVALNGAGLQGSVATAADRGAVAYTVGGSLLNLAFGQTATETFTYTMQDSQGLQSTATVTVTVTGPKADFDTDGDVDGADFLAWQRRFGKANATLTEGNSDDDTDVYTDVDSTVLAAWAATYGEVETTPPVANELSAASLKSMETEPSADLPEAELPEADLPEANFIDAAMAVQWLGSVADEAAELIGKPATREAVFAKSDNINLYELGSGVSEFTEYEVASAIDDTTNDADQPWLAEELLEHVFD